MGHGVHVAAGLKDGALAGERGVHVLDFIPPVHGSRFGGRPVGNDVYVHLLQLLGVQVCALEVPARLEHEIRGPLRGKVHVEVRERRPLSLLAHVQAVRPDVVALVRPAVREEIEGVPGSHRPLVVGRVIGHSFFRFVVEVEQPDVCGHAAPVSLLGAAKHNERRL